MRAGVLRPCGWRRGGTCVVVLGCCALCFAPAASDGASPPRGGRDRYGASDPQLGQRPATPLLPSRPAPATPLEEGPERAASSSATAPAIGQVRTLSFLDVTPGKTTTAELLDRLGEPAQRILRRGETAWVYRTAPFERVEFEVDRRGVASVVVFFRDMLSPDELARQLDLASLAPTPVTDEFGQPLGQAYPERGAVFSFAPGRTPARVAQILLEPIRAELFVQRAEQNREDRPQRSLVDLDFARRLAPANARAAWLEAEIFTEVGRLTDAMGAARDAVRWAPEEPRYRLTLARLLGESGRAERASKETQQVLESDDLPPEVKARAQCLWGDLLAAGPEDRPREAIQQHQEAIHTASSVWTHPNPAVRREATRVLIDAYLGAAHDIARGDWRRKRETALKWLEQADRLAADAIRRGRIEPAYGLRLRRETLAAYAELGHDLDPSPVVAQAVEEAERLVADAADPLYRQRISWELGRTLFGAARLENVRGDHDAALDCVRTALTFLAEASEAAEASPGIEILVGRLYFLGGSICAIGQNDHPEAVAWYDKAIPRLAAPDPGAVKLDDGLRGQWFVSMGVSYWRVGQQEKGLRLTQQGADLTRQAAMRGKLEEHALAIPYGNLAWMHKQLGHEKEARFMASLAEQAEASGSPSQRR